MTTDLTPRYRIDLCEHDSFQRLSYLSCARHEIGDGWCKGSSIEVDSTLQQIADAHQKYLDARKANNHVHAQRTWLDREALLDGLVNDE